MITTLLAVHAFVAIIAFGLLPFPSILAKPMIANGDVQTIRSVFSILVARGRLAGPLAILAALFGFWLAREMGYSYTAGWLIVSYIAFVIVLAVGIGVHARWEQRVLAAAQSSTTGGITPELTAIINDKVNIVFYVVSLTCWFVLFYCMIVRPF